MQTNNVYELTYTYYQYNSGSCDNGYYTKTKVFAEDQLEECAKIFKDMTLAIEKKLDSEKEDELENRFIPYMGYFDKVSLKRVERIEYELSAESVEMLIAS